MSGVFIYVETLGDGKGKIISAVLFAFQFTCVTLANTPLLDFIHLDLYKK